MTTEAITEAICTIGYMHEPLRDISNIRLLRIVQPYTSESPVCCEIKEFARNDAPEYKAVSYTWGDPTRTRRIFCSSVGPASCSTSGADIHTSALAVTRSCEDSLRLMRHHGQSGWFWIDFVCINQSDVGERNAQVTQMAPTFRAAKEVMVCLNPEDGLTPDLSVQGKIEMRLLCSRIIGDLTKTLLHFRWLVDALSSRSSEAMQVINRVEGVEARLLAEIQALMGRGRFFETMAEFDGMMKLTTELSSAVEGIEVPAGYLLSAIQQRKIEELSNYWRLDHDGLILPFQSEIRESLSRLEGDIVFTLLDHAQETTEAEDRFIDTIASHKWFRRLWVVEEVGLSKSLSFLIGDLRMSWMEVRRHFFRRRIQPYLVELLETRVRGFDRVEIRARRRSQPNAFPGLVNFIVRTDIREMEIHDLPDLMTSTKAFGCADPRDKLFALLPLFKRPYPALLNPDYGKTVAEVYIDLASHLIQSGVLWMLSCACESPSQNSETPSWVADWRVGVPSGAKLLSERTILPDYQGRYPGSKARVDGRKLTIRGFVVGQINDTTSLHHFGNELRYKVDRKPVDQKLTRGIRKFCPMEKYLAFVSSASVKDLCSTVHLVLIGNGTLGWTSRPSAVGDHVCHFFGCSNPYVLRWGGSSWQLLDECVIIYQDSHEFLDPDNPDQIKSTHAERSVRDFEIL